MNKVCDFAKFAKLYDSLNSLILYYIECLNLFSADQYHYLNQSGCFGDLSMNDAQDFYQCPKFAKLYDSLNSLILCYIECLNLFSADQYHYLNQSGCFGK